MNKNPILLRVTFAKRHFQARLIPTLATVFGCALLIALGFWQIQRGMDKRALLAQLAHNQVNKPTELTNLKHASASTLRFQTLTLHGQFDNQATLLLDNQIRNQQVGYHVYSLFIPQHTPSPQLLVYRGWIAHRNTQQPLSEIPPIIGTQSLQVMIDTPKQPGLLLGQNFATPVEWPLVIQHIDYEALGKLLHTTLYPFIGVPKGVTITPPLQGDWQPATLLSPTRHFAYAVQWFALALTLIIIYITVNLHRIEPTDD